MVAGLVGAIMCLPASVASAEGPLKFAGSQLEPLKWTELAGWMADDHLAAFAAYQASCQSLRQRRRTDDRGQISGALSNVCRKAMGLHPQDADTVRAFFEQNFQPVRIARLGEAEGLVTGYYEPIVAGSRFPSPEFPVPVYRRPRDLVAAGYQPGAAAFPNKGVRIGRRNGSNELAPYHDRGAIEAGALDGQKLEICWLKDPLDLLAIQMEGSARVILEDGTPLRINYDSHNGYRYSSIERVLIERKFISRKEMSQQRIRAWMAAHPQEAANVRATNRSYAFFRVTGLSNEDEPVGAQGVPLTPGRSIAVDRVHEYGTPFFIEANLPIEGAKPASPFRRLMIAQDTGSAIVGPARADLYLGAGDDAGRLAGRIRHQGRFVMLLPRELDMVAAGRQMPLPLPKPKAIVVEGGKQDGKGKADSAGPGPIVAVRPVSSPVAKSKIAALEGGKQDGKGKADSAGPGPIVGGRPVSSPMAKSKIAALEGGKQHGRGRADSARSDAIVGGRPSSPAAKSKIAAPEVEKQNGKAKVDSAVSGATAAGRQMPLPVAKSKIVGVGKQNGKAKADSDSVDAAGSPARLPVVKPQTATVDVSEQGGKGQASSASSGANAAGEQMPSPAPKPKTADIEGRKHDGKGKVASANPGEVGQRRQVRANKPPSHERATGYGSRVRRSASYVFEKHAPSH